MPSIYNGDASWAVGLTGADGHVASRSVSNRPKTKIARLNAAHSGMEKDG